MSDLYPGVPSGNWWENWNITDPSGSKQINDAYNWLQGRDATPEELAAAGSNPTEESIRSVLSGISGTPQESGDSGFDMGDWPTDLYPTSSSEQSAGLPDYANEWVKNYLTQFSPQITQGLANSLTGMENPIALNDAEKANLDYYANENLRPIISSLGAKGVLNSSTSQNAIAKVLSDLGGTSYDRAVTNQQNKINNYQKAMALLESILGTSRVSSGTSESSNPWAPYGDLMNYISNMNYAG